MPVSPLDQVRILDEAELPRARLRHQWCLSRDPGGPENWPRLVLPGGWSFAHHPDLIIRRSGEGMFLLGQVTLPGCHAEDRLLAALDAAAGSEEALVDLLDRMAGVYVALRVTGAGATVYTDPGGMMGVYHRPGIAASTPTLLPDLEHEPAVDEAYPFGGTNDWYPGTLTPFHGVRALLANHALDVATGEARRFWPRQPPPRRSEEEAVGLAAGLLRDHMVAVAHLHPCLVSLTGGRDSRVSLAALREHHARVAFFTIRTPGVKACDLEIPAELASLFGLRHVFVDDTAAGARLTEAYDEMTQGLSRGARREILGACAQLAGPELVHVSGNLGAILKSFFWHSKNPRDVRLESLSKEFTRKPPVIREAVAEWLASVPAGLPATMIYDLMYLEQRGGRWMGPGEAAASLFYAPYTPFSSRELFTVLAGMPAAALYGGRTLERLAAELWPEVGAHRYCPMTRNWGRLLPRGLKNCIRALLGS